jgi:hypothetical protein
MTLEYGVEACCDVDRAEEGQEHHLKVLLQACAAIAATPEAEDLAFAASQAIHHQNLVSQPQMPTPTVD